MALGAGRKARDAPRVIPLRELRNDVSDILEKVAAGERFRITVRGHEVADLVPVDRPRTWVPGARVRELLSSFPPDPGLLDEVDAAVDQTIDER